MDPEIAAACQYHVLETPNNCRFGTKIFESVSNSCTFTAVNPSCGTDFASNSAWHGCDILLLSGTLHYIAGWEGLIAKLSEQIRPHRYFVTRNLFSDTIPFCSVQFIVPGVGPLEGRFLGEAGVVILTLQQLEGSMRANGYRSALNLYQTAYSHFDNFPSPYNRVFYKTAIFERPASL